jgi:hypothetical protein
MKKYGSKLYDTIRVYDDKTLCDVRANLIEENHKKLPVEIQDWIRPRTEIKEDNNRRLVICIRLIEGVMVQKFINQTLNNVT